MTGQIEEAYPQWIIPFVAVVFIGIVAYIIRSMDVYC